MIQANELRLGNLVQTAIGILKVTHIKPNLIVFEEGKVFRPLHIYPIELDAALLTDACQFVQDEDSEGRPIFYIPVIGDYCLSFISVSIHLEGEDTGIKHLHKLRNLYFALTGEELPINLK